MTAIARALLVATILVGGLGGGLSAAQAADPPAGRWRIDADAWTTSFAGMIEQMLKAVPAEQRDETQMAMESQLEQLKDPDSGSLARIVTFEPDGSVGVEGGDDQVIAEGSHWEETGKVIKIGTDDPTDLTFAGEVKGDIIDMHPVMDASAKAESPWSAQLHLVLRRMP